MATLMRSALSIILKQYFGFLNLPKHRGCFLSTNTSSSQLPKKFAPGDKVELSKTFTKSDLKCFADISLDSNPVHLDDAYARSTIFGQCVVHGVLINGLVSAAIGTKLPGPGTILLTQEMKFRNPLFLNEEVTATVVISSVRKNGIITCDTTCEVKEIKKVVMTGSVMVKVPS